MSILMVHHDKAKLTTSGVYKERLNADTTQVNRLTSRLETRSIEAYMSGELSATRNVVPFSVVTTSAV